MIGVLTDDRREALNRLYRDLRPRSECPYRWAKSLQWGVPRHVVKAYVVARVETAPPVRACAVAHFGEAAVATHGHDQDWEGWRLARAWAGRLAEIEKDLRAEPAGHTPTSQPSAQEVAPS